MSDAFAAVAQLWTVDLETIVDGSSMEEDMCQN